MHKTIVFPVKILHTIKHTYLEAKVLGRSGNTILIVYSSTMYKLYPSTRGTS